jgi:hypothetical protein
LFHTDSYRCAWQRGIAQRQQNRTCIFTGWKAHFKWDYLEIQWQREARVLNTDIFRTVDEEKIKAEEYMYQFNYHLPHKDLNSRTPIDFL